MLVIVDQILDSDSSKAHAVLSKTMPNLTARRRLRKSDDELEGVEVQPHPAHDPDVASSDSRYFLHNGIFPAWTPIRDILIKLKRQSEVLSFKIHKNGIPNRSEGV
ncbi:hypothetical protein KIN20_010537 [Parelaphostrongylus tenuis]|uniref:Uncharacterized protein n=1 Tax=Parelaphostrongylus tenuis TaxID=148309 RepID=A0AAD5MCN5_PARTN|nr:hypothetical protein KIN20_010537 [Parelaphostrongylus tenuis]